MPEAPSSSMLMASIRHGELMDAITKQQQLDQIHSSAETKRIKQWWLELLPLLNLVEGEELREWISLAFLGACVGYSERNLFPNHPEHQYLYPQIIEEISKVYEQLQKEESPYNLDEIRFEIYDYGIKCVYYLDWKLYMSKEYY